MLSSIGNAKRMFVFEKPKGRQFYLKNKGLSNGSFCKESEHLISRLGFYDKIRFAILEMILFGNKHMKFCF